MNVVVVLPSWEGLGVGVVSFPNGTYHEGRVYWFATPTGSSGAHDAPALTGYQ